MKRECLRGIKAAAIPFTLFYDAGVKPKFGNSQSFGQSLANSSCFKLPARSNTTAPLWEKLSTPPLIRHSQDQLTALALYLSPQGNDGHHAPHRRLSEHLPLPQHLLDLNIQSREHSRSPTMALATVHTISPTSISGVCQAIGPQDPDCSKMGLWKRSSASEPDRQEERGRDWAEEAPTDAGDY